MFPGADVRAMDAAAAGRLPTEGVAYPLVRCGERFPFLAPEARGFFAPDLPAFFHSKDLVYIAIGIIGACGAGIQHQCRERDLNSRTR